MSFFYDLNKKLDSIRATPEVTHQQLNERDLGKHNNATTGFAALAKKAGGGEKGARIAGAQLAKMRAKGQVEEGGWKPMDEPVAKASASKSSSSKQPDPNVPGSMIVVGPDKGPPPKKTDDNRLYKGDVPVDEPVKKTTNEAGMEESAFQAAIGKKKYGEQGMKALQKAGRDHASDSTMNKIRNRYDKYDESMGMTDEGNAFSKAVVDAKRDGVQPGEKIHVGGKEYPVKEAAKYRDPKYKDKLYTQEPPDYTYGPDMDDAYYNPKPDGYAGRKQPMDSGRGDPLTKGFRMSADNSINTHGKRKGLPSRDQITSLKSSIKDAHGTHTPANFADKVGRAKKEVDEMLGDVAADAMKKAVGGGRGRNAEMDESFWDDEPTSRRSSSGGRIDTSKPGVTVHRAVKGAYSGAGYDVGDETGSTSSDGPRGRGRPKGSRRAIGAKINRGTSKLMTREGDQDPADQGEYGREGEMGRNEIHTMMRNAKQLEKMLGNNDDLPEWVQKKLSLASDYMQTIADYLASEKETDAEDQTGREVEVELAEKKAPSKKAKASKPDFIDADGDGDKTEPMKKAVADKKKKPSFKKEEEVEESTTAGSVATAPGSSKGGSKGGFTFGKGIYDSIDRAVERQINESMNISMNMSTDENGGPGQTLTITATDEDATQLAQLLKMAGLGSSESETCSTCGMADCGCGDMEQMDETYGDNVVNMNSPDYPTNTEKAHDNFGYSGGLNKQKASGMATIPVTDVSLDGEDRFSHYAESRDELARIREIAGLRPMSEDKAEWLKPEGMPGDEPTAPGGVEKKKEGDTWVYKPKDKDARLTSTIPSKYVDPDKKKNESIFTNTANLWKRYKG